jgi:formylglycine-generating enzyme required for sulfatase activity
VELKGLPGGQPWIGRVELEDYQPIPVVAEVLSGDTKLLPVVKLTPTPQKVTVTSEPGEAAVMEGGLSIGQTPWEAGLREVGSAVELTLRKAGYDELPLRGEVALGETLMLQGKLKASVQKVTVTSEPTGAEVLEGGKSLGKTPFELTAVSPGTAVSYQLRLEAYEEAGLAGRVEVGEPLALGVTLKPLPKPKFIGSQPGEEKLLEIAPGVNMTFCWIPPGEFLMGSPAVELGREANETQQRVTISKGFWLAKTEVTQGQWKAAGGIDVSGRPPAFWDGKIQYTWEQFSAKGIRAANFEGGDLPLERVDWNEVRDWCADLGERLRNGGGLELGWQLSLPTEAQWEYACRAGTNTALNNGRNLTSKEGACRNLDEAGWYGQNSGKRTHAVGTKKANAWGLHDMHGNVWEWCADWYGEELVGGTDPSGAASGVHRVSRGGSWYLTAAFCRAANRDGDLPGTRNFDLGFRPALVPSE